MTELESHGVGEAPPSYIIFVVVFLFFITGLLGFLICHMLKKKGYHCRTGDMDDDEEEEKLGGNADDDDEENQDTVEQILKCIIENEANMEAFNEMFGNQKVCVRHDPRLRKESIGGVPPHLHTVHSGADHNSCHLCAQVRSKKGRRQSRTPRTKQRPGEQTVFSVGRFRVTHSDKKLPGTNPLASSGDQLDQSQDSEERKEGGYNLRSMFKDARQPSEGSNGVVPNVGKRRKSLTIFSLRRGSDPSGIKLGEGTGRETGGVRFAIQKQPVVMEELSQAENIEVAPKRGTKPETEPSKNETPASPGLEAKTSGSVSAPSSQSKDPAHGSKSAPEDGTEDGPSPESHTNLKPSVGTTAASVPNSLPIPSPDSSGQTFKTTEEQGDVQYKVFKNGEAYDPGPLQTSTPIAPVPGFIPGFTPTGQPEPRSSTAGIPVAQTPPDPSSSPDLESGFGASPPMISQGSSPPSSIPIRTPSSASSLQTPISPLVVTPSPKLSSRNTPTEAAKTSFSPALTPSPKLPSGRAMSTQHPISSSSFGNSPSQARTPSPAPSTSPKIDTMPVSAQTPSSSPADQNPSVGSSPRLTLKSGSATSVTSVTKGNMVSSPVKEQELGGDRISTTEEKTEIKRVGILKNVKPSPVERDSKGPELYSPTDQSFKSRLSSLPLSPSSLLSPSSPTGSRISSVAIVKASPDSKREFSVVTMVEDRGSPTLMTDQKKTMGISPGVGQAEEVCVTDVGQPESRTGDTPGAEVIPKVGREKDDVVEMEDIKDCKVTQGEEAERLEEESKQG